MSDESLITVVTIGSMVVGCFIALNVVSNFRLYRITEYNHYQGKLLLGFTSRLSKYLESSNLRPVVKSIIIISSIPLLVLTELLILITSMYIVRLSLIEGKPKFTLEDLVANKYYEFTNDRLTRLQIMNKLKIHLGTEAIRNEITYDTACELFEKVVK